GTGYVAEVGLTGLSTAAILYRAHLAEHRGELGRGWQARALWALMIVPLAASITANLTTGNALGAACAVGAAAFALLAIVVADRSAAAMQARAAEVDAADEAELQRVAMGEDLFAPVDDGDGQEDGDGGRDGVLEGATRVAVHELEAWLAAQEPPEAGAGAAVTPRPEGGPDGAAAEG